jgi:uncharacterized protein (DUF433 family)
MSKKSLPPVHTPESTAVRARYTITEAARIIGMPRSTLGGWVGRGRVGGYVKGHLRVSFNELVALYKQRRARGGSRRKLVQVGSVLMHAIGSRNWSGIVINPCTRAGMPNIRNIPVSVIADRARVETIEAIVADYSGLLPQHVKAAVAWSCTSYPVCCPTPECCHERCPYWPALER